MGNPIRMILYLQTHNMDQRRKITQAKIDVRYHSRELIKVVFHVADVFPKDDPEGLSPAMRKKVLAISSFLTHGTVKSDREEQNNDFLTVMGELRELLKLITIAHHLKYCSIQHKTIVREGITKVIDGLEKLVILSGGFTS